MFSNLLTLVGVLLILPAVAALAGGWWATLAGGVVLVGVGYVAERNDEQPEAK